jgi:hypothetical protein
MISWNSPPSFKASQFDLTLDQKKIKLHKQTDPQEENFLYNFKMFYFYINVPFHPVLFMTNFHSTCHGFSVCFTAGFVMLDAATKKLTSDVLHITYLLSLKFIAVMDVIPVNRS